MTRNHSGSQSRKLDPSRLFFRKIDNILRFLVKHKRAYEVKKYTLSHNISINTICCKTSVYHNTVYMVNKMNEFCGACEKYFNIVLASYERTDSSAP